MNWLNKLERKFRWFGISHLMIYVTATMLAVYLMQNMLGLPVTSYLLFLRENVLQGEVWRLLSFIFVPPNSRPIFIFFALYFYYFIGESLENAWGSFAFTFYYLCGIVGTVIAGFLTGAAGNFYLNMSLFFAFAQLYPNHQVRLFFLIPIKMKYLAFANWLLFGLSFVSALFIGDWVTCASIVVALLNYFLFFGPDFLEKYRNWRKYGAQRRQFKKNIRDNDFWR